MKIKTKIMNELIEKQDDEIFVRIDKLSSKDDWKNIAISVRDLVALVSPPYKIIDENIEDIKQRLQSELANLEIDEYDIDPYLRTPKRLNIYNKYQLENQFIKDIARLFDYQSKYLSARKRLLYLTKIMSEMNYIPKIEDNINNDINDNDRLHSDE